MASTFQFGTKDVEIVSQETVFDGFFKMVKMRFRHKLFAGGWGPEIEREILERGDAVAVLPYDPVTDEFIFIEQIRIGALRGSQTPWLLECVAGMIDKQESPEEVAQREAQEEAGVEITQLYHACSYLSSPGGTSERMQVYIGETDVSQAGGIHGLEDENEDILVHRVSLMQAQEWLEQGKIDNAATVIALQWFLLNKEKLCDEWRIEKPTK